MSARGERPRAGATSEARERVKLLEHEGRELCQVNAILRKTGACFAQAELDCPFNDEGVHPRLQR